ncbi:Ycf66 family protein [Chrysosporum bergii ANA360D]|uniref:Ycf66 family protein n=1 Tax=Chrysosporum bergii ANA360D TaxID=617107 RepID=A0AA43GUT6_9CYAN|nr:Ycf66 family protein [Chrysosporum bergii]MDH6061472.1 Ycf66 family protein [Chrysosporum bergii ANA360D]
MINFGLNSASVLAQVNFGTNSASILGIFLAVSGAALYFLRTVRPELSRDQDIFFAAVGLLCGFILIFQGWRLDPILQFNQLLLVGSAVFFAVESIRLRGIATQQAKRNTPIVDEEREVSRNYSYNRRGGYEAEVEGDLEPLPYEEEEPPVRPRIRGTRDTRSAYDDYYEDEPPRRPERRSSKVRPETKERKRRPSSGPSVGRSPEGFKPEDWSSSPREVDDRGGPSGEVRKSSPRGTNRPPRPDTRDQDISSRPRKRRPPADSASPRLGEDDDVIPTEYVPYNPIDKPNQRPDNSSDFDDGMI